MTKTNAKTNNDQTTNDTAIKPSRPKIRLPYDYDEQKFYSELTGTNTGSQTETQQSEASACDINEIVRRAQQTGILASKNMNQNPGNYGDYYDASDFKSALDVVRHAEEQFAALPSNVREEFANDPARFLAAIDDPKQQQKLVDLGLATAAPLPKSTETAPLEPAQLTKQPETAPKGS